MIVTLASIPECFWEPNEKEFGKLNSQSKLLRKYVDGIFTSLIDRDDHNNRVPLSGSHYVDISATNSKQQSIDKNDFLILESI
ncbi:hypothetical protein C1646_749027 [Rhizophagus diaphanus]|nr:hypothetical protein C1646_749027 [Rhizophagus diaphanus] [Rhizophagus sp. MUCL 43196]